MTVSHKKESGKGLFFIEADNGVVAEMTYAMPFPDKMIIDLQTLMRNYEAANLDFN